MPHTETPGTEAALAPRLRWWTELPLILLVYACYSAGRLLVRGDVSGAVDNGLAILKIEKALFLNAEHPLNRLFTREAWIGIPADFWYASLHYLVTPAILIWLFRSRTVRYRAARTWLWTSTFVGLIGFTLLPTCPPRLLDASHGFVDTMAQYSSYGWWGGEASAPRGLGGMTNQYAAMPSLHVGWALWCGVMLWRYGGTRLAKTAAVAYPLITTIVVMGTANHYFLDAVAGAAVMGVGLLLAPLVMRTADRVRARFLPRFAPAAPVTADTASTAPSASAPAAASSATSAASSAAGSSDVSAGCQTSAGERIPRQRDARFGAGAEPSASPQDAGDGAPAAAR
ncbi:MULTISPECIES: phosphatase PAP2 family protein [Streptomyces]|uniref:Phosphatase PAP2 family protein n=1 Tax=Streptomyces koelreuteriae TaxID=2838015 RepID=A0ABX8G566_9ACTN|nr:MULTISPECIES: phosphatase PAP2 family protein [Streptomyces]QWB28413.1 phosphatase PAP2 family protein [Streptomyces koelreuteriae]UUA11434.1 phosphatase PAP2 family protein [Streptomyces koelreuteriae]UUA19032.1 phosphatase PAP2 family protein [Streptomyces sp. CRCS-T-1]